MRKSKLKNYAFKRFKDYARRKSTAQKTSLLSASAVGLLLAGTAEGQERNPGVSIQTLEALESWTLTETGDLRLLFENGSEQIISASDFTIVDGTYYISETLAVEIMAALEAGSGDDSGIVQFALGLAGLGAAGGLAQNGGSSASTGNVQPPVKPGDRVRQWL